MTKLFKNTQVKIAYTTNVSLETLLHNNVTEKKPTNTEKVEYTNSVVPHATKNILARLDVLSM